MWDVNRTLELYWEGKTLVCAVPDYEMDVCTGSPGMILSMGVRAAGMYACGIASRCTPLLGSPA